MTRRWRRQSRANSSLKPNSLLAGSLQGISSIRSSAARQRQQKKRINIKPLRANSLRIRTGNFLRPCREFKSAIREISVLDQRIRSRPLFGLIIRSSDEISNDKEDAAGDRSTDDPRYWIARRTRDAARSHRCTRRDQPKAARNRPLHVGALGAPDGLEALEGLALVFKPEE